MISPPRAETKSKVRPGTLDSPIFKGWWGQVKMNGQYLLITVANGKLSYVDRHGDKPDWSWTPEARDFWSKMPNGIYAAELLHKKVKGGPRDTFYVHDLLDFKGKSMVGVTYEDRYTLLQKALSYSLSKPETAYYEITPKVWLAKNHTQGFRKLFDSLDRPEYEGLVLKNPAAPLTMNNAQGWTVKIRKPHGNFPF